MTLGNSNGENSGYGIKYLHLYGQKEQTGMLDVGDHIPSIAYRFAQYGGNYRSNIVLTGSRLEIYRGTCDVGQTYNLFIYGGNVHAKQYVNTNYCTLGWTELTDSIKIDSLYQLAPSMKAKFTVSEGQALQDEDGNIYTGTLTDEQVQTMLGKTLTPYLGLYHYGEPKWIWTDDDQEATAVFTCTDEGCGDVQRVEALVTVTEDGDYKNCRAVCTFLGEEYTAEKRVKTVFGITVSDTGHGAVTPDKNKAKAGEEVYLSFSPDSGYALISVTATGADGEVYTDGYSFEMPAPDVIVSAAFTEAVPMKEPYIDENGAYILGNVAYCTVDGVNYAVNEDGTISEELDDVSLSYFDFRLRSDDTYQIIYCTGPAIENELVIPKTFNGKKITVLGNNANKPLYETDKTQFNLTLNENITEIRPYTFYVLYVKEVKGDTSALNNIGSYAFSWANSPGGYTLDIRLDYPGTVNVNSGTFNNMNVTAHLKHSTTLDRLTSAWAKSFTYDFTDAHPYGEPKWSWAEDYSSASATFTCPDSRCKHEETPDATVERVDAREKTTYTASVTLDDRTYTDEKIVEKGLYNVTIADTVNGTVTADLDTAYEGEEITLTVASDERYVLYSLTVTDAEDNEIEVTEDYHFTMPASDVTVTARFAYTYIIGDVDGDGEVAVIDATLIQRMDAGLKAYAFDEKAADIDGEGWSITDASWIRRFIAFMDVPYDIGKTVIEEPE